MRPQLADSAVASFVKVELSLGPDRREREALCASVHLHPAFCGAVGVAKDEQGEELHRNRGKDPFIEDVAHGAPMRI